MKDNKTYPLRSRRQCSTATTTTATSRGSPDVSINTTLGGVKAEEVKVEEVKVKVEEVKVKEDVKVKEEVKVKEVKIKEEVKVKEVKVKEEVKGTGGGPASKNEISLF